MTESTRSSGPFNRRIFLITIDSSLLRGYESASCPDLASGRRHAPPEFEKEVVQIAHAQRRPPLLGEALGGRPGQPQPSCRQGAARRSGGEKGAARHNPARRLRTVRRPGEAGIEQPLPEELP